MTSRLAAPIAATTLLMLALLAGCAATRLEVQPVSQRLDVRVDPASGEIEVESATDIVREAYDAPAGEVDDTLDRAEQRIFQIAQASQRQGFVWIKEILWPTFEHIEQLQESKSGITGVPTGFKRLDTMTAGLQPGDLIILAARPGMGIHAAARAGNALR